MEIFLGLIVLFSMPCKFCYVHILEYYESPFSKENFGAGSILAAIVFLLYLFSIFYIGIDGLYDLSERRKDMDKFWIFFIEPSFGFAIAIFNKVAADGYLESNNFSSNKFFKDISRLVGLVGWLLIGRLAWIIFF